MQLCPQLADESTQHSRSEFLSTVTILPRFACKSKLQCSRKKSGALGYMDACANLFNWSGFAKAECATRISSFSPRHKSKGKWSKTALQRLLLLHWFACVCRGETGEMTV